MPFFPLGSGFTADNPVLGHPAVQREAAKRGHTPAQIALAWTLSVAPNVLLIPGTSSVQHLEENTAVADIELDDETLQQLNSRGLVHERSGTTLMPDDPQRLVKFFARANTIMRPLLKSPLHALLSSRLMLLSYIGGKTGTQVCLRRRLLPLGQRRCARVEFG